jgi:hypothetical protein
MTEKVEYLMLGVTNDIEVKFITLEEADILNDNTTSYLMFYIDSVGEICYYGNRAYDDDGEKKHNGFWGVLKCNNIKQVLHNFPELDDRVILAMVDNYGYKKFYRNNEVIDIEDYEDDKFGLDENPEPPVLTIQVDNEIFIVSKDGFNEIL